MIVCEGARDKSESAYFKALIKDRRNPDNRIEVKVVDTRKNTGRELVREAKRLRETPRDEVWVVYDKDGYTLHPQTFDEAHASNVRIAFSSISFEYWIVLHFGYTTCPFADSAEVIHYLETTHGYRYGKGDPLTYAGTKAFIADAKLRASQCRDYQRQSNPPGTPVYEMNPWTDVDELVERIERLAQEA
jgi:hypothetical protein